MKRDVVREKLLSQMRTASRFAEERLALFRMPRAEAKAQPTNQIVTPDGSMMTVYLPGSNFRLPMRPRGTSR